MKKIFALFIMAAFILPVFAQEEETVNTPNTAVAAEENTWKGNRQLAASFDPGSLLIGAMLGGLGVGLGFEYAPIKPLSAKIGFQYMNFNFANSIFMKMGENEDEFGDSGRSANDTDISMFRFYVEVRWYPAQKYVAGFYTNLGFQFHMISGGLLSNEEQSKDSYKTTGGYWGIGYKGVIGAGRAAFFMEPWVDIAFSTKSELLDDMDETLAFFVGGLLGVRGLRWGLMIGAAF